MLTGTSFFNKSGVKQTPVQSHSLGASQVNHVPSHKVQYAEEQVRRGASTTLSSASKSILASLPKKNNFYLYKMSEFYNLKIPMGVREMCLAVPMMISCGIVVWYSEVLLPVSETAMTPPTTNLTGYILEPIHSETGTIKGYRRIENR
eukprot:Tbor_TRINITY_DN1695_c0_g1::TRINITY_DN1695_c0_g1_i1::g.7628::m.7628